MQGTEEAVKAWEGLDEYIKHIDRVNSKEDACREDLTLLDWTQIQEVGKAVGVDQSDHPTKTELRHRLAEEHVFIGNVGDGRVYQEQDGEIIEVDCKVNIGTDDTIMSETESTTETEEETEDNKDDVIRGLMDQPYGDLMNAARSMNEQFEDVDITTDAPKKNELIDELEEYELKGSRDGGWTATVDGEEHEIELLQVQTPDKNGSNEPKDKTIFYCLTRAETTEERIAEIKEALESNTDFELKEATSDKYSIVLPVEAQDLPEPETEDEEEDESEDEAEEAEESESSDESDSSEEEGEEDSSDEEPESEPSEAADEEAEEEDDEDDDEKLSREVVRERLEDKTDNELYDMCVDYDVPGRSNLVRKEKIEALLDTMDEVKDE